ncbi:MAG: DUF2279 domain-containing protein [Acidobacteriota bacterium]
MWFLCLGLVLLAWWRMDRQRRRAGTPREPDAPRPPRPLAAGGTLAGAYGAFAVWMFVAWYHHHKKRPFKWGGDGWLGRTTYAGGADKAGHAWATMSLARLGTVILTTWGGYSRRKASLLSASLSQALFTGVEVKDGFYYEFSFSDLAGDTTGAVLAALLDNFPRLDELFDYRVDYWPSQMYRRKLAGTSPCPAGGCSRWNIAEDYSGQSYLAAFHLGGIGAVRDKIGPVSRFVDVAAGFGTRNYRPLPDHDITEMPHQDLFLGLAFNAQGFFDWLLEDHPSRAARSARKVTHGFFEVFQMPQTTLRLLQTSREGPMRYEKASMFSPRRPPAALRGPAKPDLAMFTTNRRLPASARATPATTRSRSRPARAVRSRPARR